MRGKTIAISRPGDQTYYYVRDILKRYGIGLKDVRLVQTGLQPERVAALRQGLAVASILNRPNNLVLEQEGYKRLLDIEDLKLPAGVRCLITTRKLLKARPATIENFTMAWLESVHFILRQKKETKEIIGKYAQHRRRSVGRSLAQPVGADRNPALCVGHPIARSSDHTRRRST